MSKDETELLNALKHAEVATTSFALAGYQHAGDPAIYTVEIPFGTGIAAWRRLRTITPAVGYWPILGWVYLPSPTESEASSEIIAEGLTIDARDWFEHNQLDVVIKAEQRTDDHGVSPLAFHIPTRLTADNTPSPSATTITFAPTTVSWEVPAYLRKTEHTQPPHVHVAIHKYWNERWGSELVGWDASTAECATARPPRTVEDALPLAQQQYNYCPDLVSQNVGSVSNLARLLVNCPIWWFWWD